MVVARRKVDVVSVDDLEKATDCIIGGVESNKIMSRNKKSIVAHHDALIEKLLAVVVLCTC